MTYQTKSGLEGRLCGDASGLPELYARRAIVFGGPGTGRRPERPQLLRKWCRVYRRPLLKPIFCFVLILRFNCNKLRLSVYYFDLCFQSVSDCLLSQFRPHFGSSLRQALMASNRSISSSEPQPPERSKSRVVRADPTLGIALLPELYVKRKAGHQFNVMLLGQTGVGKTTLIDTLFRLVFKDNSSRDHCSPKVEVIAELYDLNECGVDLRLGVIETRGFGDQMLVGVGM